MVLATLVVGALLGASMLATFTVVGTRAHAGVVYTPPASIDNTGQTDVTDALNQWIANDTADGTAGDPSVIQLTGVYRIEYGLKIGNGARDVAQPGLPPYRRNHVVLDLTNATLLQTDPTPYRVNHVVVQPRKRWGVPMISIGGETDVTIEGGHLQSTNTLGTYSAVREPWAGVWISSGSSDVSLIGMDIEQVWGDFVNIGGQPWPQHILIDGGHFERNGRQGVTFNDVDDLEIRNVDFVNVERLLFDHEPIRTGGATNVYIHDNTGNTGGMGYMQLRPGKATPLGNIRVENNHLISGHFHVIASAGPSTDVRTGFTFIGNTTDCTTPYSGGYLGRQPLVFVPGDWDSVTVTGNHDVGKPRAIAVFVSPGATNVTVGPNDFVGFRPGTT